MVKINESVCSILKRGDYLKRFGAENVFLSKADAIGAIFDELDHDRCARCERRIFQECGKIPPLTTPS